MLAWLVQACSLPSSAPPPRVDAAPSVAGQGDSHVVHSARLHELMAGLRRLPPERLPQELDSGRREAEVFVSLVETARRLEATAGELPASIPVAALEPAERQRFEGLAAELGQGASELEKAARRGDRSQVARVLNRLEGTCDACHLRYRPDATQIHLRR